MLSTRRLFEIVFFIALFTMAVRESLDPDMWWHLRTGQIILEEGIPRQDVFSFTAGDHEWITHEWLSQLSMWISYSLGGFPALILLFAGIITLSFMIIYWLCPGRPYLAAFVILLAAFASAPLWGVRPQMVNLLFVALFIFLVERFKDGKIRKRTLWLLPLGTLIWANLHSGYLLGIAILGAYVIGEAGQLILKRNSNRELDWSRLSWLGLMTILSFLAAVVNPNGIELWLYPFLTLGSNAMQQYIQEWHSPSFHQVIYWPFAILLLLGVISFVVSRPKPSVTDVLLFTGTGAAGLLSIRHIPIFATVASPIVARYLLISMDGSRAYRFFTGPVSRNVSRRISVFNFFLLFIIAMAGLISISDKVWSNDEAIASTYPVAAVDYLEQSGLAVAKGYNSYNWGGYLIWRGIPVFVDGRADVYGDVFLNYYRQTLDLTSRWRQPLQDHAVDYVIIEHHSPLSNLLRASGEWQEAYADSIADIYVRAEE